MSPLPRLHHHDIMTNVGLFFIYLPFITICHICIVHYNTSHNVGALKVANLHCSHQWCVIAEWSGRSNTVRVRIRARTREWDFSLLFCFSVLKCNKGTLLWHGVITPQ